MPRYQPKDELREARTKRKLSQKKLAELLGTKAEHIGAWERGEALPEPALLAKLCVLLAMPASQLGFPPELYQKRGDPAFPPQTSFRTRNTVYPVYDPAMPLPSAIGLIGRDDEFAWLKRHLCSADNITTALNGLPGVGKTTLAIALAHDPDIRAHFHDGILWAGLGPNPNVQALLFRWATLLGISTASTSETTSQTEQTWKVILRDAIGERALLLVLDDVWRIEHAHALQVGGPHCRCLVTTRFPTISAQMTIEGGKTVHEMGEQESMLFLQLLAPRVVELEPEKTRALVHAVGGLPLALTLMSNYLRIQSYSGQGRRIQMALERLLDTEQRLTISEPYWPAESHPSLQAETSLSLQSIIAVTDHELSLEAQTAFYSLAIFPPKPNSFSEEAALATTACTTQILDVLSDAGLVESNGSGRYTLHQAIADYARLHLDASLFATNRDRLIVYVTNFVKTHKKDYELLEIESSTIRAVLDMAYESELTTSLVQLVCACAPFLILRGLYLLAEKYLERAYAVAQSLHDSSSIAEILLYLGEIAQHKGDYVQAETYLQEGLASARQINNSEHMCALLTDLGGIARRRGNYAQAEAYLQEGFVVAQPGIVS